MEVALIGVVVRLVGGAGGAEGICGIDAVNKHCSHKPSTVR